VSLAIKGNSVLYQLVRLRMQTIYGQECSRENLGQVLEEVCDINVVCQ
jgi:hypothetical protein